MPKRSMNMLFWSELFTPHIGGIEVNVGNLALDLTVRGHRCAIVTDAFRAGLPAEEVHGGVSIYRLPIRAAVSNKDIRQLQKVVADASALRRMFRPDIDGVFVSGASILVQRLSNRKANGPTIASMQNEFHEQMRPGSDMRQFLADCSAIVVVSRFVRKYLADCAPELVKKFELAYCWLLTPTIAPAPLPLDPPVILCLGRLVSEKGFDVALHAFARLRKTAEPARMIVAGDGPERRNLESLCRELGLGSPVDFLGLVDAEEITALINRTTLMVTPSRGQEAFGLVSLQAAQMARPVVATRVGGIPEAVEDAKTGLLVDKEDVDAMAEAITTLLNDHALLREMGTARLRRAREVFDFAGYVDRYEDLLRKFAVGSP
jgi:glycosyltransferase involved in cell wall biosynthesis